MTATDMVSALLLGLAHAMSGIQALTAKASNVRETVGQLEGATTPLANASVRTAMLVGLTSVTTACTLRVLVTALVLRKELATMRLASAHAPAAGLELLASTPPSFSKQDKALLSAVEPDCLAIAEAWLTRESSVVAL